MSDRGEKSHSIKEGWTVEKAEMGGGEGVEGERKLGTEMERGRENVLTVVSRNGEGR